MTSTKNEEPEYIVGKEYILTLYTIGCMEGYDNVSLTAWEKFAKEFGVNKDGIAQRFYNNLKDIVRLNGLTNILEKMASRAVFVTSPKRMCSLVGDANEISVNDSHPLVISMSWKGLSEISDYDANILANFATSMVKIISCNNMFASIGWCQIPLKDAKDATFTLGDITETKNEEPE